MACEVEIAVAIRLAQRSDLDAVNAVVERAVASWARTEHVKRGSLPDIGFCLADLDRCMLLLAIGSRRHVLGVAACRVSEQADAEPGANPLHIDGPYIHPDHHDQGIGAEMVAEACALARRQGRDCLLVAPRVHGEHFLDAMGMSPPARTRTLPDGSGYLQQLG